MLELLGIDYDFCWFLSGVNSVESLTNLTGLTQFVSDLPEFTHR